MRTGVAIGTGGLLLSWQSVANIMSDSSIHSPHPVRQARKALGWSQEELARKAKVSRAAVSAIEQGRSAPSVQAALDLARALGKTVEALFGTATRDPAPQWVRPPSLEVPRFWHAEIAGRVLRYPVEATNAGAIAPHGVQEPGAKARTKLPGVPDPEQVLLVASCDPAVGLLAEEYARQTSFRLIPLARSSGRALRMLEDGEVHLAGLHYSHASDTDGNQNAAAAELGSSFHLLRIAEWEAGLAFTPRLRLRSTRSALRSHLSWIGREEGSGARAGWDELFPDIAPPERIAFDHRGVATAIQSGWAEAGICLRLVSDEAELGFLPTRTESYDLCVSEHLREDPRVRALFEVVRSFPYRRLLDTLPGFGTQSTGAEIHC